jgi:hypothetical protein
MNSTHRHLITGNPYRAMTKEIREEIKIPLSRCGFANATYRNPLVYSNHAAYFSFLQPPNLYSQRSVAVKQRFP